MAVHRDAQHPYCGESVGRRMWLRCDGIFLASELACQVDGLNVSPNQLMVDKKKVAAAKLSPKVQLRLQDAESFVYPADYYDLVWTMESSEHFADKQKYFHQVRRTLRPA